MARTIYVKTAATARRTSDALRAAFLYIDGVCHAFPNDKAIHSLPKLQCPTLRSPNCYLVDMSSNKHRQQRPNTRPTPFDAWMALSGRGISFPLEGLQQQRPRY